MYSERILRGFLCVPITRRNIFFVYSMQLCLEEISCSNNCTCCAVGRHLLSCIEFEILEDIETAPGTIAMQPEIFLKTHLKLPRKIQFSRRLSSKSFIQSYNN